MKKIVVVFVLVLLIMGTFAALSQNADAIQVPPRKDGTVRTENGGSSCVYGGSQCIRSTATLSPLRT